jgi:hypothetical protein
MAESEFGGESVSTDKVNEYKAKVLPSGGRAAGSDDPHQAE